MELFMGLDEHYTGGDILLDQLELGEEAVGTALLPMATHPDDTSKLGTLGAVILDAWLFKLLIIREVLLSGDGGPLAIRCLWGCLLCCI